MQTFIWISLLVLMLIVVGVLIMVAVAMRKSSDTLDPASQGKYPRGYWISIGISIGVGIGAALGISLENIGIGIALGTAIGVGIGASLEQRYKDNIRPLTGQENKRQRWGVIVGLLVMLASVIALALLLFSRIK